MSITPYLLYENVAGALQFLAKAFGFRKNGCQMLGPDGKINHAAMQLGEDFIMMGYPGAKYKNPNGNDLGFRHGFRAQADSGVHPGNESGHDSAVPWRAARLLAGEGLKSERCTDCNFVLPPFSIFWRVRSANLNQCSWRVSPALMWTVTPSETPNR